ncbi:hypothetical protein MASR2M39_27930 [Ignavibacteriales bacterium]
MKQIYYLMVIGFLLVSILNAQNALLYKIDLPDMSTARMTAQVVKGYNGNILSLGGHTTGFSLLNTGTAIKDTGVVFTDFNLSDNRDNAGIIHLKDSTALLVGGMSSALGIGQLSSTERIYPHTMASVAGPNMIHARTMANGVQLLDGRVLVTGCWYNEAAATQGELINLSNNLVVTTGNLNQPRAYPTIVATNDGNALLFGGWGVFGGEFSGMVEEYNTATNQFTVVREQLFADDPDFRVVTDFGEDMQNRTLPDGKKIFLARKFQNGTGWRLFTVDPATKQIEVYPGYLPVADTSTGAVFIYLSPVVDNKSGSLLMIPRLSTDGQGVHHLNILFGHPGLGNLLRQGNADITLNHWPYYAARTIYNPSHITSGIIFMGGNISSNFDPVPNAFVAVLNDMVGINETTEVPAVFSLTQNYPNPFSSGSLTGNSETVIRFVLPVSGYVEGLVYDVLGREVANLVNGEIEAGSHELKFNADGLPSGIYIFHLKAGKYSSAIKMVVEK